MREYKLNKDQEECAIEVLEGKHVALSLKASTSLFINFGGDFIQNGFIY